MIKKMIIAMIALMSVGFCAPSNPSTFIEASIHCYAYNAELESLRKETTPETDNKYISECIIDSDTSIQIADTVENSGIWVSRYQVNGKHIKVHYSIKNDIICTDWLGVYEKDSNYPIEIVNRKNKICTQIVHGSNGDTWRKIVNMKKGNNWIKFVNSRYNEYDSAVVNTARRKAMDDLVKFLDTIVNNK